MGRRRIEWKERTQEGREEGGAEQRIEWTEKREGVGIVKHVRSGHDH